MYRVVICGWTRDAAVEEMKEGGFHFNRDWQNLVNYVEHADVDALKKRGITDLNLITCYATPGGYIALPEQDGRRIGWGGCEYNIDSENGMEDREVGGIFFTVDMTSKKLTRFTDYGVVPMAPVSEVYDAEHPYLPGGCVAQAWSVAELLRCLVITSS